MPSSTLPNLTNLAGPQPTMLLYAALSPFGATDDRKITANALLAEITANITDLSVQWGDGLGTATVSAAGKGKIRYNDTTKTFQFSADGAAYVDFGGGSTKWNAITNPDGNLALTMAAFTTVFTWDSTAGNNQFFTITTVNNDSGVNTYLLSIETPGATNGKRPFRVRAQGNDSIITVADGSTSFPDPSGSGGERVGLNSRAQGGSSVAFGNGADARGLGSIAIGADSDAGSGGQHAIAIGNGAQANHQPSIAIGSGAVTTASGQFVVGDDTNANTQFTAFYWGSGVTDASPNDITFNATGQSGSDKAGKAFNFASGKGTGVGVPGRAHIQCSVFGSTGTTLQSLVDRAIYGAAKILANNTTTTAVNVTVANDTVASGIVDYAVEVFDGAAVQLESGSFLYQVTNDGGAIANNTITFPTGYPVNVTTAGTLTVTWTITAANPALLRINANSSLTPSTGYPRVTYTLRNLTSQAVAVQ